MMYSFFLNVPEPCLQGKVSIQRASQ